MLALRRFLVVLLFIGLYLNLGIWVGATYVGGMLPAISGMALLLFHLKSAANVKAVLAMSGAAALWMLTIPFAPSSNSFWLEGLKSALLLMTSVLSSLGIFFELKTYKRRSLALSMAVIALALISLSFLEINFSAFRNFSNIVRDWLYAGRYTYLADERDMLISGGIRPNLFTQEPSHLAKAVSIALAGAVILSKNRLRYLFGFIGFMLAMLAVRSPTMLLSVAVVVAFSAMAKESLGQRQHSRPIVQFMLVVAAVAAFSFLPNIAGLLPFERAQMIASGRDNSVVTRSTGPMLVAFETAKRYPIAGAGIGGRELVGDIQLKVFSQFPAYSLRRLREYSGYTGWGNAFFEMLTYCGFFMGVIILPSMFIAMRAYNRSIPFVFLIFFLVFNFDGGFPTARPWTYFGVLMAMVAVARSKITLPWAAQKRRYFPSQHTRTSSEAPCAAGQIKWSHPAPDLARPMS